MLSSKLLLRTLSSTNKFLKLPVSVALSPSYYQLHSKPTLLSPSEETKKAFQNLSSLRNAPNSALLYGLSGLIPFTSIPAYMVQTGTYIPELAFASLAYGAVILSFLGGVRWGVAVPEASGLKPDLKNLGWAVTPSLIGWTSLLTSNFSGSLLLITGFSLCLVQDLNLSVYPSWYKSLRIILSTVAIAALVATLLCHYVLPKEQRS